MHAEGDSILSYARINSSTFNFGTGGGQSDKDKLEKLLYDLTPKKSEIFDRPTFSSQQKTIREQLARNRAVVVETSHRAVGRELIESVLQSDGRREYKYLCLSFQEAKDRYSDTPPYLWLVDLAGQKKKFVVLISGVLQSDLDGLDTIWQDQFLKQSLERHDGYLVVLSIVEGTPQSKGRGKHSHSRDIMPRFLLAADDLRLYFIIRECPDVDGLQAKEHIDAVLKKKYPGGIDADSLLHHVVVALRRIKKATDKTFEQEFERALQDLSASDTQQDFFSPARRSADDEIIVRTVLGLAVLLPRLPTLDFIRLATAALKCRRKELASRFQRDCSHYIENLCRLSSNKELRDEQNKIEYKYVDFNRISDEEVCQAYFHERHTEQVNIADLLLKSGIVFGNVSDVLLERLSSFYGGIAEAEASADPQALLAPLFEKLNAPDGIDPGDAERALRNLAHVIVRLRNYNLTEDHPRRVRLHFLKQGFLGQALVVANELGIAGARKEALDWIEEVAIIATSLHAEVGQDILNALQTWLVRHPWGELAGLVDLVGWLDAVEENGAGRSLRREATIALFPEVILRTAVDPGSGDARDLFGHFVSLCAENRGDEAKEQLAGILSGLFQNSFVIPRWWYELTGGFSQDSRLSVIGAVIFYWHIALSLPDEASREMASRMKSPSGLWPFILAEVISRLGRLEADKLNVFLDHEYRSTLKMLANPRLLRENREELKQYVNWLHSFRKEYYGALRAVAHEKRWYRGDGQAEALPASA